MRPASRAAAGTDLATSLSLWDATSRYNSGGNLPQRPFGKEKMKPFRPKRYGKAGPEAKIQVKIIKMLETKGWWVKTTHGNAHTDGWPDLLACHKIYGTRWIEVKRPNMQGSKFTKAQLRDFPKFACNGSDVWVLTSDKEEEYQKLFAEGNWYLYTSILK